MLDTDSKDLVTVHTDGNEQLSVMSYGPGTVRTAGCVFPLSMHSVVFTVCLSSGFWKFASLHVVLSKKKKLRIT